MILWKSGVLQREVDLEFSPPGGPFSTICIFEIGTPRRRELGHIRKVAPKSFLLKIPGAAWPSQGILAGRRTDVRNFESAAAAKVFAREVFGGVGKDWMGVDPIEKSGAIA